jgi:hypothetical protein
MEDASGPRIQAKGQSSGLHYQFATGESNDSH